MKIGLIGNMNNNNFSLMRYFRDLGADAHLLLHSDDGEGSLSHFRPECDTWNIERWAPYIHRTPAPNAVVGALDAPSSHLLAPRAWMASLFNSRPVFAAPVSRAHLRAAFHGYDRLLGSGPAPAILGRIGRKLDVYYPYSIAVEYLENSEFTGQLSAARPLKTALLKSVARRQADGIRAAGQVVVLDGVTQDVVRRLGVEPVMRGLPMVYNREPPPTEAPTSELAEALTAMRSSELSIVHHARLLWDEDGGRVAASDSKNNHWLLIAISRLIRQQPRLRPLVVMIEYGPDVDRTRRLASELGISDYVRWMPKMARRELSLLLAEASIVCGEFYPGPRMVWGGTGWEALAAGRPLLQGFNFRPGEFEHDFGHPPPPILAVRTLEDVESRLAEVLARPALVGEMGEAARSWFDAHNGISLAERWLEDVQNAGRHV
jgi:hypothetical protein